MYAEHVTYSGPVLDAASQNGLAVISCEIATSCTTRSMLLVFMHQWRLLAQPLTAPPKRLWASELAGSAFPCHYCSVFLRQALVVRHPDICLTDHVSQTGYRGHARMPRRHGTGQFLPPTVIMHG